MTPTTETGQGSPGADPRMSLTLKDMPKWPRPEKRLPLVGETRDHYADGSFVSRHQRPGQSND